MAVLQELDRAQIEEVLAAVSAFLEGPRASSTARDQLLEKVSAARIIAALSSANVQRSDVQPMVDALRAVLLTDDDTARPFAVDQMTLVSALKHDNASVRTLALDTIHKLADISAPLADAVLGCLDDSETQVGQAAHQAIMAVGLDKTVALTPRSGVLRDLMDGKGAAGQTAAMRVTDLYVRAASTGSEHAKKELSQVITSGLVDLKHDLLARISFFETLTPITESPGGLAILESNGVFEAMSEELKAASLPGSSDIEATLSASAIMRVLTGICSNAETARHLSALAPVMRPLRTILQGGSSDLSLQESALAVLGALGTSKEGWKFLREQGAIDDFVSIFQSTQMAPALRPVCLDTLARLISGAPSPLDGTFLMSGGSQTGQHTTMLRLMKLAKEPFEDIRMACLCVYGALAMQEEWGTEILAAAPGFVDYICDTSELDKQLRAKKVDVASSLGRQGARAQVLFGDVRYGRLLQCGRQNPTSLARPEPQVDIATLQR